MSEVLAKYLPEHAVLPCFELIKNNSVHLKIVNERQTRHGDYRRNLNGKHEITVNGSLNKYRFLITLSELLAEEYKEQGIAFNVLALGAVNTEMLQEAFPGYEAPISSKEMADYIFNFALTGHKYHNGKSIQVSSSTP